MQFKPVYKVTYVRQDGLLYHLGTYFNLSKAQSEGEAWVKFDEGHSLRITEQ